MTNFMRRVQKVIGGPVRWPSGNHGKQCRWSPTLECGHVVGRVNYTDKPPIRVSCDVCKTLGPRYGVGPGDEVSYSVGSSRGEIWLDGRVSHVAVPGHDGFYYFIAAPHVSHLVLMPINRIGVIPQVRRRGPRVYGHPELVDILRSPGVELATDCVEYYVPASVFLIACDWLEDHSDERHESLRAYAGRSSDRVPENQVICASGHMLSNLLPEAETARQLEIARLHPRKETP